MKIRLFAGCFFLAVTGILAAQEVRASLSSREGLVGLPITYEITITGTKGGEKPELSGLEDFEVTYQGESQHSQFSNINGQSSRTVIKTFSWLLTPLREGELDIPAQNLVVEGKSFQTPSGTVSITPPKEEEGFGLSLSSDRNLIYMGEALTVTMEFLVTREVGNLNFTLPGQSAGDRDGTDYRIIESTPPAGSGNDIRQIAVGNKTFYGSIGSRYEEGTQYTVLSIPLQIMPLRTGEITLEGARVSFVTEEGSWPRTYTQSHIIPSPSLTVTSGELPREIKESPNGAVFSQGPLAVRAEISASEARPGDPLTLTVFLEGIANPAFCDIPPLGEFTPLEESFSLPTTQSKAKAEGDTLTLVQTIRPRDTMVTAVPALEFTYLDLESHTVRRVSTQPLPLAMSSAGKVSVNDMEVFGSDDEGPGGLIANDRGIRQNKSLDSLLPVKDRRGTSLIGSSLFLLFALLPPGFFLVILLIGGVRYLIRRGTEKKRNTPYVVLQESINEGQDSYTVFDRYLRDRYFKGKSFTRRELENLSESENLDGLVSLYTGLEESRFGGAESKEEGERLIDRIKKWESRK